MVGRARGHLLRATVIVAGEGLVEATHRAVKNRGLWSLLLLFGLLCLPAVAGPGVFVPPTITYHPEQDVDGNGIDDALDIAIVQPQTAEGAPAEGAAVDIIVTLFVPVTDAHLALFSSLGGSVGHVYQYVSYGFSGSLPREALAALANGLGDDLCIIEPDRPTELNLEDSTRIIGARPGVWSAGYQGTNEVVAIIDTGLDSTHPDVAGARLLAWYDVSGQSPSYADYHGHGTHVASTLAGTGAAIPAASLPTMTSLTYTFQPGAFPYEPPGAYGWVWYNHYPYLRSTGTLTQTMFYQGTGTRRLGNAPPPGTTITWTNGTSSGFTQTRSVATTGRWTLASGAYYTGTNGGVNYTTFSTREAIPYVPDAALVSDGYNLFTGVAPAANLVIVKYTSNSGGVSGTGESAMTAAMDWVVAQRDTYDIKVASMSSSLLNGGTSSTFRDKADNVVANGIVFCVSAGNNYPTYAIGDPALAPKVIAVAATNDHSAITSYSSNGSTGTPKPDVAAPGGSTVDPTGTPIMAADTNSSDAGTYPGETNPSFFADQTPNDYREMSGTSMACPHVAGLAGLVIQALEGQGYTWTSSQNDALKVKSLILMTAYETGVTGESSNTPPLTRDGAKDVHEGYGRICADAAIEAVTQTLSIPGSGTATLGSQQLAKRVWARRMDLNAGASYSFNLTNPAGGDFDLYLYSDQFTTSGSSLGDPILVAVSATNGVNVPESIAYTPATTGTYYVVTKWVSGEGAFTLTASAASTLSVSVTPSDPWLLGVMKSTDPPKTTWTTTTPAQGGFYTATNDGSGDELLRIKATTLVWTPGPTPGPNVFTIGWGQTAEQGTPPGYTPVTSSGVPLDTDPGDPTPLLPSGAFAFDLQFQAPTSSTDPDEQLILVTVEAHQP